MNNHNFVPVGADTDGIAFRKPDQSPFTKEERQELLGELNSLMDTMIRWEDDGVFPTQLVIKTKNYVLVDEKGKVKIKGSGLKATNKEKALQDFTKEVIHYLVEGHPDSIPALYTAYAKQILNIQDISRWASKQTITKAVLTGTGTTQVKIRNALKGRPVQEGDKIYTFFLESGERCLLEDFTGQYDAKKLLGKLYDTLCIFKPVLDLSAFPDLTLKRNLIHLEALKA